MALIKSVRGKTPRIGKGCFIAENAVIIGDVILGDNCSIWYGVVIRGDVMPIRVGNEVNIQDSSVLHGTYGECGVTIEDRVTIGHSVLLHGCLIQKSSLIGMGSIVMDRSKIGPSSLVGAGSLVTENTTFETQSLILGRPAKFKRKLTAEELASLNESADNYLLYKTWYEESSDEYAKSPTGSHV